MKTIHYFEYATNYMKLSISFVNSYFVLQCIRCSYCCVCDRRTLSWQIFM